MGIKPKFGSGVVKSQVEKFGERLDSAVVFLLKYMGEMLAKYAKENHTYTDQTGNLTNSIGYAIVRNGKLIHYGGEILPGDGAAEGLKVAMAMAASLTSAYTLIIVAGMNYAAYVEAKGYNVILPAELKAKKEFPAQMQRLKELATKKANELFGNVA